MRSSIKFQPGSLIRARGRQWVVQANSSLEGLYLRPLGGADEDVTFLVPELEIEAPEAATFPAPDPELRGNHSAALLLKDALQLKLRSGAGPFRSFGNIAVEPRAYQLVPLLMALRQPVARLLIADDVGIGKTIEAGLIVRELLDRGEIQRFAVLCPPHLVDQWQAELEEHFHLRAIALTASSASRLERNLASGVSLFEQYPFVVVSLDYIKSDRHRAHFLSIAPDCIIVDEAHTCSTGGRGRQLRYDLLRQLAEDEDRHLLLLTATPHSGDDKAFSNLISLLRREFSQWNELPDAEQVKLRELLATHLVQRRRRDIEEWQDVKVFPRRMTAEVTYNLSGEWGQFFDEVQAYCTDLAERTEAAGGAARHMIWYATLALLRCVGSSPAAAEKALKTRLDGQSPDDEVFIDEERLQDGDADDLVLNDLEPAGAVEESSHLQSLIAKARTLKGQKGDPKLAALIRHLDELLKQKFRPVVFCRYIATAHYIGEHLSATFPKAVVDVVSGEYTSDERKERVQALMEESMPILVATDCLSEGVNLQEGFTAVVHYDLAWNPTRHEQREGRVDRFGQERDEVRCSMIWGQDNPVDGFILRVIIRKAKEIQDELGVLVPLPQDEERINQAMIKAALLKRKGGGGAPQLELGLEMLEDELSPLQTRWEDARERAKANRTIFAQRRIKPDEVLPEWRKQVEQTGNAASIERFVSTALARFNAPLEEHRGAHRLLPQNLPRLIRERLAEEGLRKEQLIDFHYPPRAGARFIHRTHPLVSILADVLVEEALQETSSHAARCAATVTDRVTRVTTVFLLRLRHQLTYRKRGEVRTLMAEETVPIAVEGRQQPEWQGEDRVRELLALAVPKANLSPEAARRSIQQALNFLDGQEGYLESIARDRANALLEDHRRVRQAARDVGSYTVSPCLPVDVIGTYVLLPEDI